MFAKDFGEKVLKKLKTTTESQQLKLNQTKISFALKKDTKQVNETLTSKLEIKTGLN